MNLAASADTPAPILMLDANPGSADGHEETTSSTNVKSWILAVGDERVCFSVKQSNAPVSNGFYARCSLVAGGASSAVSAFSAAPDSSSYEPYSPVAVGDTHVCYGLRAEGHGDELFCTDVASGFTRMMEHSAGTNPSYPRGIAGVGEFVCYGTVDGVFCWAPGTNSSEAIRVEHPASGTHATSQSSSFQVHVPTPGGPIGCFAGARMVSSNDAGVGCFSVEGLAPLGGSGQIVEMIIPLDTDGSGPFEPSTSHGGMVVRKSVPFGDRGICFSDTDGLGPMCWNGNNSSAPFPIALPSMTVPAGGPANLSTASGTGAGFGAETIAVIQAGASSSDSIVWFTNYAQNSQPVGLQDVQSWVYDGTAPGGPQVLYHRSNRATKDSLIVDQEDPPFIVNSRTVCIVSD